jgi:prevent-host-death family protein
VKSVSIQDLKQNLSTLLDEAAAGTPIVITRHKRPVAVLSSAGLEHCHVGSEVGRPWKPAVPRRAVTRGRYLELLRDDRRGGRDR